MRLLPTRPVNQPGREEIPAQPCVQPGKRTASMDRVYIPQNWAS